MKKLLCTILALLCVLPCVCVSAADDIIYIGSFSALSQMATRVNGGDDMRTCTVVLTKNITVDETYIPIGNTRNTAFSGVFDGNGYEISGLAVSSCDFAALFGCVSGGTVKNLKVKGSVSGENYCALVVGRLYAYSFAQTASVINCSAQGTVNGKNYVGGIVGYSAANGNSADAEVSVEGCSFKGSVAGDMYVGGVLGKTDATGKGKTAVSIIKDSLAVGTVTANGEVGSLAGGIIGGVYAKGSAICRIDGSAADCTISAKLLVAAGIAGACGADDGSVSIDNCASYGVVTAEKVGGISADCGVSGVRITSCISDISLFGAEIYVIAPNADVENCFAARGRIPADNTSFSDALPAHTLYSAQPHYEIGDVNGDNRISPLDALAALRYDAGLCALSTVAARAADSNADGKVSPLDASLILQYDAKLITKWPRNK